MGMEMEMVDLEQNVRSGNDMGERLMAVALRLEAAAERLAAQEIALEAASALEERLKEAEATIAQLRAQGGSRRTLAAGTMVAKEGTALEAGALDLALTSLSLEQRIAVKAQLLRSGLAG